MIDLSSVSFSYKNNLLFNQLDLSLKPGISGLLGKNGAGKSTLLKIMAGLLFPENGSCRVLGSESAKRIPEVLSRLFFLPEEIYLPSITVSDYLKSYAPFYPKFDSKTLFEYMDVFEVDRRGKLSSFSFGQKKKFIIAFGLSTGADIILLDEPTNGLDIPSKTQFRKLIVSLPRYVDERTIMISTHQVRDLADLIDPVIIIDNGKIIFNYTIEEILEKLEIRFFPEKRSCDRTLYMEKVPGGWVNVSVKGDESSDTIDFEVLFNAVISNSDLINRVLKGVH